MSNDTLIVNVNPKIETMHISGIGMSTTRTKSGAWYTYATATVTVVDSNGSPVSGAEVRGTWSRLTSDIDSGLTSAVGKVALSSNKVKNANGTFTFTITNIIKTGWQYNPGENVEISDSITVSK